MPVKREVKFHQVPDKVQEMIDSCGFDREATIFEIQDPFPQEVIESGVYPISRPIASHLHVATLGYTHNVECVRDLDFQGIGIKFYEKRNTNETAYILLWNDWDEMEMEYLEF